ncbi:hypothetical protein C8R44DRAFT_749443 [Mycena epipterygia]|nr:hypothetical protein C8R44DRAFT_749443 [Mycena epipterygia]
MTHDADAQALIRRIDIAPEARATKIQTQIPSLKCESGSVARLWLYLRLNSLRKLAEVELGWLGSMATGISCSTLMWLLLGLGKSVDAEDVGADTILNSDGIDKSNQRHGESV